MPVRSHLPRVAIKKPPEWHQRKIPCKRTNVSYSNNSCSNETRALARELLTVAPLI